MRKDRRGRVEGLLWGLYGCGDGRVRTIAYHNPACVESSLVLLEEGVCYDQCIFLAKLHQSLPCFILYSKAKFACYSRCFLTSCFCIPVPYNVKGHLFWVLVLEGLVGLHRTVQLQLLQCYWLGHRLGFL